MREYIVYSLAVFLPLGALMSLLLRKQGLLYKHISIIVGFSLMVIISFPVAIKSMGWMFSLFFYVAILCVLIWYLLNGPEGAEVQVYTEEVVLDLSSIKDPTMKEIKTVQGMLDEAQYGIPADWVGDRLVRTGNGHLNQSVYRQDEFDFEEEPEYEEKLQTAEQPAGEPDEASTEWLYMEKLVDHHKELEAREKQAQFGQDSLTVVPVSSPELEWVYESEVDIRKEKEAVIQERFEPEETPEEWTETLPDELPEERLEELPGELPEALPEEKQDEWFEEMPEELPEELIAGEALKDIPAAEAYAEQPYETPPEPYSGGLDSGQRKQSVDQHIEEGFAAKFQEGWAVAAYHFEEALNLADDPELRYLVVNELAYIYREEGFYHRSIELLQAYIEQESPQGAAAEEIEGQIRYYSILADELERFGKPRLPYAMVPRMIRMNVESAM